MKRKLKKWQKILLGYTAFVLIIAIVATSFYLLATSPDVKYGIVSGIIEHSEQGTDITDSILNAETASSMLENDKIAVSITQNGNISVLNKQTGKVWSSSLSPEVENSFKQGYNATHSLCEVTYVNDKNAEAVYTSYDQCVMKKQLRIYRVSDDTIRLDYILGESNTDQLIPPAIEKERFEKEILPNLSQSDQDFMKRQYLLYYGDKLTADDNPDQLLEKFPKLEDTPLYIAGNISGKVTKEKLTKVFEKIGYTAEDYDRDNALTGYGASSVTVTYKVVFDISISENDLVVSIPKDEIEFYREYPMLRLSLMKFFMSSTESSSVLIPSGSGALARFVPGQTAVSYSGTVYGNDAVKNDLLLPSVMDTDSDIRFPLLAMRSGEDTITAMIESGDANAEVKYNASESGVNCYFDFTFLQSDRSFINAKTSIIQCGNDVSAEDICVRYRFGSVDINDSDDAVYSSIAHSYREYLIKSGKLPTVDKKVSKNPIMLLELIGSVEVDVDFLGLFPVSENLVMTSFSDAQKMVKWFSSKGADNLSVNLNGWDEGGLYRQTPGSIDVLDDLGGEDEFEDFAEKLEKIGVKSYYSAPHTRYYNPSLFGGYSSSMTSLLVDRSEALFGNYSAVEASTTGEKGEYAVISPSKYCQIANDYIDEDIKRLAVSDLASCLNSDYGDDYHDRSRTKAAVIKALESYADGGVEISAQNANMYALKYCNLIENMPITSGDSAAFNSSFPFSQLVLHGIVDYTTEIDFSKRCDKLTALQAIRTGAGLKAALSYSNSNYEFPAYYSNLFSTDYKNNRESLSDCNEMVLKALSGLGDVGIKSFEQQGEVSKTIFANGTVIYVNTADTAVEFDTQKIDGMSYLRIN